MNVIEAWKAAKGKMINRRCFSEDASIWTGGESISSLIGRLHLRDETLLADDWEVVKVKRKVRGEIKEPHETPCSSCRIVHFFGHIPADATITATWEEE